MNSSKEESEKSIIDGLNNKELIEHLKIGLKSASRAQKFVGYEYTREKVLNIPELKNLVPWFLKHCENVESFYVFIKKQGSYEEREKYIDKESIL